MIIEVTIKNWPIAIINKKISAKNWVHAFRQIATLTSRHPAHLFDWMKNGIITYDRKAVWTFKLLDSRIIEKVNIPLKSHGEFPVRPDVIIADDVEVEELSEQGTTDRIEDACDKYLHIESVIESSIMVKVKKFWKKVLSFFKS